MKLKLNDIVASLQHIWPDLVMGHGKPTSIAMPDSTYYAPKLERLKGFIFDSFIDNYRYTAQGFDCDDYALLLHAFAVQERYKEMTKRNKHKEEWLSWPFGRVWGTKFRGKMTGHAVNICITQDKGVYLIEPQNDVLWKANGKEDLIHFVSM